MHSILDLSHRGAILTGLDVDSQEAAMDPWTDDEYLQALSEDEEDRRSLIPEEAVFPPKDEQ